MANRFDQKHEKKSIRLLITTLPTLAFIGLLILVLQAMNQVSSTTISKQQESLEKLPMADPKARAFRRFIYANAFECEVDKQGRLLIPANLKDAAKIDKELVTIGMLDRVEIWAKESYESSPEGGMLSAESFADFADKYQV